MRDLGFDPVGTTPQRFGEFLKGDALKWKQMIQEAGIKASSMGNDARGWLRVICFGGLIAAGLGIAEGCGFHDPMELA